MTSRDIGEDVIAHYRANGSIKGAARTCQIGYNVARDYLMAAGLLSTGVNPETATQVRSLYAQHVSITKIAEQLDIPYFKARDVLVAFRIPRRPQSRPKAATISPAQATALSAEGATQEAIARQFRTSPRKVREALRAADTIHPRSTTK